MQINSFLGIHNTQPPRSIPDNALADAVDVDITDSGALLGRRGYTLANPISGITAAYSTQWQEGYVVVGGILNQVNPDGSLVPLGASTASSFTDYGKAMFTNDGLRVEGAMAMTIKVPSPSTPLAMQATTGDMPKGRYSATYTYVDGNGLEGGSAPIASVDVEDGGGVYINPPQTIPGYSARVYVTDGDGTVFYDETGRPLDPIYQLADSFPDNVEIIAFHQSRLYATETLPDGGTVVRYSQPFYFHLWDYAKAYFIVPGQVLGMVSVGDALVIGTDSAIWAYTGDAISMLADYGVVPGYPMRKSVDGQVFIHSKRGQCKAAPFTNLTQGKCSLAPGSRCSSALVDQRGIKQFLVLTDGTQTPYNANFNAVI